MMHGILPMIRPAGRPVLRMRWRLPPFSWLRPASTAKAQIVLYVTGRRSRPMTSNNAASSCGLGGGGKTKSRQEVINELIDDKLKVLAGKRFNFEISDTEVDSAFANIARNAGASADQFAKQLRKIRRQSKHLEGCACAADLTWGQIVRGRYATQLAGRRKRTSSKPRPRAANRRMSASTTRYIPLRSS